MNLHPGRANLQAARSTVREVPEPGQQGSPVMLHTIASETVATESLRVDLIVESNLWRETAAVSDASAVAFTALEPHRRLNRAERDRKAAELLGKWMEEHDGYDEWIGPLLDEELKNNSVRLRDPLG